MRPSDSAPKMSSASNNDNPAGMLARVIRQTVRCIVVKLSAPGFLFNRHVQMADGSLALLIGSLDAHKVVARFSETMLGHRITIRGVLIHVAIRSHRHLRAAVAEVPRFVAEGSPETA